MGKKLSQYLELIRWQAFFTFAQMVGGFFAAKGAVSDESALMLARYFFILGPLLYGGLYIFNNIVDYPKDIHGKTKRGRPLVSGAISLKTAWLLLLLHLIAVLTALTLLGFPSLLCQLVFFFLVLNVFYTLVAKDIPFFDLVICSLGHPARTAAGILLAAEPLTEFWPLLAINLLTITALNVLKRLKEKELDGAASRPVLKFYTRRSLILISVALVIASCSLLLLTRNLRSFVFSAILIAGTAGSLAVYLFGGKKLKGMLLGVWR